jgi:hypothetical protein
MKRIILTLALMSSVASAQLPHKGQCLTFALAYCVDHYGCELVIVTYPVPSNGMHAHVIVYDHGRILDNMHPIGIPAETNNVMVWLYQLGEKSRDVSVFRVIQYNRQSLEDAETIQYLKGTEQ